jgi:hypothetical protein
MGVALSHSIKSRGGRTSRRSDRLGIDSHLGRIHEKRHSMKNRLSSHSMKNRLSSHSMKSRSRTSRRSDRLGIDSHLGRIHERHSMKNRWSIPTNNLLMMNLQINEGTIWCWRRRLAKANLESMAWKQR